jgi:RES domain
MSVKYICPACTTNAHLKEWIQHQGDAGQVCAVCGTERKVAADILRFAQHVEAVIRKNTAPVTMPDPDYDDFGEDAKALIGGVAGVAEPVAQLVVKVGRARDREFYDYPLSFVGRWPDEHHSEWRRFREIVKHEARFIGPETRTILDRLFGGIGTVFNGVAVRTLNPGDKIYRARLERSRGEADRLFKSPETELTAPPYDRAIAGRMNAAGIRVFYAALREDICVAELRPPVSSHVVLGAFTPTRPVRVLGSRYAWWDPRIRGLVQSGLRNAVVPTVLPAQPRG